MSQVSTILWDVGGVLLTNGWDHVQRYAVLEHFGLPREPFERIHAEVNDAWERDQITVEEYLQKTVFCEPRQFTPQDFLAEMKKQSELHPNTAIGLLRQVAASDDLAVGIMNNESRELNDFRIEKFGFYEYFDCFVSSCYVGLRKPHPEIYKLALDLLQRDPDEVLFIDDREGNIATATDLGMHGIVHKTAKQTAMEMDRLGIHVDA
ncbi:hydrolase family protein [Acidisarcina polymorpha]|uniref:Hydrolase family protein n=1 Tax=Acidisarcina polymorpha TaxID=2211140 RepID=A0A2Z5G7B5_9BACT|nr:HAD family phosphatase [Acidisarcina polymorpha]AXC14594.1 hydrolase family protein [Acidisarcina polymorpha]